MSARCPRGPRTPLVVRKKVCAAARAYGGGGRRRWENAGSRFQAHSFSRGFWHWLHAGSGLRFLDWAGARCNTDAVARGSSSRALLRGRVDAQAKVRQAAVTGPRSQRPWCETNFRLAAGDPAGEILHFVEKTKADLIVMSKGADWLAGHVPGTTANKVVSKAHSPVLTVRS